MEATIPRVDYNFELAEIASIDKYNSDKQSPDKDVTSTWLSLEKKNMPLGILVQLATSSNGHGVVNK